MGPDVRTWLRLAREGVLGKPAAYRDGERVFAREDGVAAAFLLTDGHVEIFQTAPDGRAFVVRVLGAPCLFGVLEACGAEPRYLEGVRGLGRAEIFEIALETFHAILHREPAAALECLATTAMAFCRVAETEGARLVETEVLLAAVLLVWGELFGQDTSHGRVIKLRRSQAGIAGTVGASERHVQRLISAWRKRRMIDIHRGRYLILDAEALRQVSDGLELGLLHRVARLPGWVYG
jgi:CRP-like cAMP-binding protein